MIKEHIGSARVVIKLCFFNQEAIEGIHPVSDEILFQPVSKRDDAIEIKKQAKKEDIKLQSCL